MIQRLFFFILVCIIAVIAPTGFFAVCAFAYALRYTAYELIIVAATIDAYYGLGYTMIPYYTIITCIGLLIIEWIKPRISVYNQ